jgi:hypothetical protein
MRAAGGGRVDRGRIDFDERRSGGDEQADADGQ